MLDLALRSTPQPETAALLDAVDALVRGPRFHSCALDQDLLEGAVRVARVARVRAYDAVYIAHALARAQPLFTLDAEVLARCQTSFPDLAVVRSGHRRGRRPHRRWPAPG